MDLAVLTLLAQQQFGNEDAAGAAGGLVVVLCQCIVMLVFLVPLIAGMWKTFEKAGKPGWASIIPIYNAIVLLEISGRPIWWILLFLIPCVGIVFHVIMLIDLSKNFGQGAGFAIGLLLLPMVFYPILGFGSSQYRPVAPTSF
jgi:uncharacterized membrane protein YhaH (DUF805 family)